MDNNEKLKLARDWYNDQSTTGNEKILLETLFPELKESEDERIRKNCIHFLKLQKEHHASTFEIEECIAWLEKQGEQNPTWSEEDKDMVDNIFKAIQHLLKENDSWGFLEDCFDWLKSIKNRVQPHWKPTEEQLMALRDAIDNNEMELLYNDLKKL